MPLRSGFDLALKTANSQIQVELTSESPTSAITNSLGSLRTNHRSASGTGSPGSRGPGKLGQGLEPGLIIKSGTETETQIENLRDSGP